MSSTPKTVWIAHARVDHKNGYVEQFICGVYVTQAFAVECCKAWWVRSENRDYKVSYYDDGDAYLHDETGFRSFVIQKWSVEIPDRKELSVGQHEATHP